MNSSDSQENTAFNSTCQVHYRRLHENSNQCGKVWIISPRVYHSGHVHGVVDVLQQVVDLRLNDLNLEQATKQL